MADSTGLVPSRASAVRPRWWLAGALLVSVLLVGCTGIISDPSGAGGDESDTTFTGDVSLGDGSGTCDDPPCDEVVPPCLEPPCEDPSQARVQPSDQTRFARLTHDQWDATVRDLLYLDDDLGFSDGFIGDPTSNSFSTNTVVMQVGAELWQDYQRGAEQVANYVVSNPDTLAAILPPGVPSGDLAADRDAFLETFGTRAFRRPIQADEVARYASIFDRGSELMVGDDPWLDGIQIVLEAMFQSPHFVYRVELSDVVIDDKIRLDGWEVATRLSYSLWGSMPSDDLFAAAEAGELGTPEGIADWIRVMLADPRARPTILAFHRELLHTDTYTDIDKDTALYPEFVPETGRYMQQETDLFIENVVFDQTGTYGDLLMSTTTFVNDNLAQIYGIDGSFDDNFVEVELDPSQRAGLLTRSGFLAKNANAFEHDPIHRGVEVALNIICSQLAPPPDNVPPVPPGGNTVRERVDMHTGMGTCGEGCHSLIINPAGFAFENFDALGRYQFLDNDFPVDASGQYVLDGEFQSYNDAVEFSGVLAGSVDVHNCYSGHWLEYLYGRPQTALDVGVLDGLAVQSRDGAVSIQDMITALLLSEAFLTRAPDMP